MMSPTPDLDAPSARWPEVARPPGGVYLRTMGNTPCARAALCALVLAVGCAEGAGPSLSAIGPQRVSVHQTLRVPLIVNHGASESLSFRYEGPDLPGLDRTASISGNGSGGEFRWVPLASHVGTHEFTFVLARSGGGEADRQSAVITVSPSDDSAPVFLRPGAGGTFDLERDPCVRFDIEVRDDDSARVEIRARNALPEGATIFADGPKQASFEWCPSPDQTAASERWTIEIEADDGDHDPVELDFIVVLRTGDKEGCPGTAPEVRIDEPTEGQRVTTGGSIRVALTVSDDMGLRDAPLLYYSTSPPDDLTKPDVTMFDQVAARPDGAGWAASIPSLGLELGAERTLYVIASATDNDDASGALCDHRTDTALRTFVAVGGEAGPTLGVCDECSGSDECDSGVCASGPGGARCLRRCGAGEPECGAGTCGMRSTLEGASVSACGDTRAACDGSGGTCTDDGREDDDTPATARAASGTVMAQICAGDVDHHRISANRGDRVEVSIAFSDAAGDLDLRLLDSAGTILDTSAGTSDTETVEYCMGTTGEVIAKVEGFLSAEGPYTLTSTVTAGGCGCIDDPGEDDDTSATARPVGAGGAFDGTICPMDNDYVRFTVSGPANVRATIVFTHADGDLDLELFNPSGAIVGFSRGTTDIEEIDRMVTEAGTYTLRVFGYREAEGEYVGELVITESSGCTTSRDCPSGRVCDAGTCVAAACTSAASCPSGHGCPVAGPAGAARECGEACSVNSDCKSSEACKWFPEGRFCARRGSAGNGAACTTFADCGGQRACLDWPGGYCARVGCETGADCESDTVCVDVDGRNVCARDCIASDEICRLSGGYECAVETDVDLVLQWSCQPS